MHWYPPKPSPRPLWEVWLQWAVLAKHWARKSATQIGQKKPFSAMGFLSHCPAATPSPASGSFPCPCLLDTNHAHRRNSGVDWEAFLQTISWCSSDTRPGWGMGNDGSVLTGRERWQEEAGEEKAWNMLLCFLGRDQLLLYVLHKPKEAWLLFLVHCLYFHTVHYITELKLNDHFRVVLL